MVDEFIFKLLNSKGHYNRPPVIGKKSICTHYHNNSEIAFHIVDESELK